MKTTIVALASVFFTAAQSLAVDNTYRPLVVFSGSNSAVSKPLYSKITSKKEWDKVWAAHLGTSVDDAYRTAFEVDFDKFLIVAILRGDQINVRGVQIDRLIDEKDAIVMKFSELSYQTANESNNKPPDKPFAFVVLPNTNKQIILEEGTSADKGQPLNWNELIRLK